jgi:hypothetical protein
VGRARTANAVRGSSMYRDGRRGQVSSSTTHLSTSTFVASLLKEAKVEGGGGDETREGREGTRTSSEALLNSAVG